MIADCKASCNLVDDLIDFSFIASRNDVTETYSRLPKMPSKVYSLGLTSSESTDSMRCDSKRP